MTTRCCGLEAILGQKSGEFLFGKLYGKKGVDFFMVIITEREIEEYTRIMFYDDADEIVGKHSPINGEKDFVLCMIEQVLGLIEREAIDDARVITYTQSMISVAQDEMKEYSVFLDMIFKDPKIKDRAFKGNRLTPNERKVLKEMMKSNLGEYLLKSDDQLCCYTAIKAFFDRVILHINKRNRF